MDLKNKIALITGASSGLGAETARALAKRGVKVALLDQKIDRLQVLATEIQGIAIAVDVCDEKNIAAALQNIISEWQAIHIGVNCAGIADVGRIVGRDGPLALDEFKKVIDINLTGTFNVLRLLAAQMSNQVSVNTDGERGIIINTASVAAFEGQIGQAAYSASKGGIVSLTLPAARELARFGIRVMAIAPGVMDTPMVAAMSDKVRENLQETIPFPKRFGEAAEFASLVIEIIQNSYLNGSVIRLDAAIRMG